MMKRFLVLLLTLAMLLSSVPSFAEDVTAPAETPVTTERVSPIMGIAGVDYSLDNPNNFKGKASGTSVKFTWSKVSGATGYLLYEAKSNDAWIPMGSTKKTSLTLKNVSKGKHTYLVASYKKNPDYRTSYYASVVDVTVSAVPSVTAPENLVVKQTGETQVLLSWRAPENAKSYTVYRSTKKSSGYKKVKTLKKLTYTDKVPKAGKTYYYKVEVTGKINGKTSKKATSPVQIKMKKNFVPEAQPTYRALLIGNTYPGTSSQLPGPDVDAKGFAAMLKTMATSNYTVTTAINVTAPEILAGIGSAFAGATANDVSVFYYSGHGVQDFGSDYHGALCGTEDTYIRVAELKAALDTIPGTKVVILDSCFSGQFIGKGTAAQKAMDDFNSAVIAAFSAGTRSEGDLASSGYYVMTAASLQETSVSTGTSYGKPVGLMTEVMLYGSGYNEGNGGYVGSFPADKNKNGSFTFAEVANYTKSWIDSNKPDGQHTQLYFFDGTGSIPLWKR